MKKNRNISISLAKGKIAWFYLLAWISGIFAPYCAAADDDKKPDGICVWISGICCCRAAVDVDDQKSDDICPVTLRAQEEQEEQEEKDTISIRLFLEKEKPPVGVELSIPRVAREFEDIYRRFFNGVLIFRPNPKSDDGMVKLPIRDLTNPLEGTFDLSRCGDMEYYLSISTGYRKGYWRGYRKSVKPENLGKFEIWIAPKFLIERKLNTTAAHFRPIMSNWKQEAQVGLFWTWVGWDLGWYDYLTTQSMDELSHETLNDLYLRSQRHRRGDEPTGITYPTRYFYLSF